MKTVYWRNVMLSTKEQSGFERAICVIVIILSFLLIGWGPMG